MLSLGKLVNHFASASEPSSLWITGVRSELTIDTARVIEPVALADNGTSRTVAMSLSAQAPLGAGRSRRPHSATATSRN